MNGLLGYPGMLNQISNLQESPSPPAGHCECTGRNISLWPNKGSFSFCFLISINKYYT
jgi:hypothetical protein